MIATFAIAAAIRIPVDSKNLANITAIIMALHSMPIMLAH